MARIASAPCLRRRLTRASLHAVFAVPLANGLGSIVGLVSALTGDGARDALAWIALAAPVSAVA